MTEAALQAYLHIADWPTGDAVAEMIANQSQAADAVAKVSASLACAADEAAARLGRQGRLIYAGAGTSGRIGVQDGVELGPTYGWPKERMVFLMAGGQIALMQAVEGAEDDHAKGMEEVQSLHLTPSDVVIGLAASGSTPYTIGVIEAARAAGALTIGLANKLPAPLCQAAEIGILIETGAEVIAGSTRMKAGTCPEDRAQCPFNRHHDPARLCLRRANGRDANLQSQASRACQRHDCGIDGLPRRASRCCLRASWA